MAGIRITHVLARSCRFTVVEGDRPYPSGPYQCPPPEFGGCGIAHPFKTHHLNLDDEGAAIVETALYQRLRNLLVANGFTETNEVAAPPPLGIGLGKTAGQWGGIPIVQGVITRG